MPRSPDGPDLYQGAELLFSDGEVPGLADRPHSPPSRLHPTGTLQKRGPLLSERSAGGPLHLAAPDSPRVGDPASLRRPVCHLCLVRCPHQLYLCARLAGGRGVSAFLAQCPASDRQGYPETSCDLLADYAEGRRTPAVSAPECPRLLEDRRGQDVQEPGRGRSPA